VKRTRVALFGLGYWSKQHWLPPLLQLVKSGHVELYLLDLFEIPPANLDSVLHESFVSYIPWSRQTQLTGIEVVIVVVPAKEHQRTVREILGSLKQLRYLICEKPAGDSLLDFSQIAYDCIRTATKLIVTDHYLLRPSVQALLRDQDRLKRIRTATTVKAYMLEERAEGPPEQDVNLDMLIHPLDLLHTLFPKSRFNAERSLFARAIDRPHAKVTYCLTEGGLDYDGRVIACRIEVGKQLRDDKRIVFTTPADEETLSLALEKRDSDRVWSYHPLLKSLLVGGRQNGDLAILGGLSYVALLSVWNEMENVRAQPTTIERYRAGTPPTYVHVGQVSNRASKDQEEGRLLEKASAAAEAAGEWLLQVHVPPTLIGNRGVRGPATLFDCETEAFLRKKLRERGIAFIGEEEESSDEEHVAIASSGRCWVVDPVDGTENLIAGRPEVAVSVAFVKNRQPVLGVIALPTRGLTVRCGVDKVLEVNARPWIPRRRPARSLEEAVVALPGDLWRLRHTPIESLVARILSQASAVRITGALAYDLACLALGEIDARISTSPKLVDVAAGVYLVRAVGGIVTDWEGNPWTPSSEFLAARTAELHQDLLKTCRKVLSGPRGH